MTVGYVFASGAQQAITKEQDGSNLPAPKLGRWKFIKKIDDVNKSGLIVCDPQVINAQGYQIWPEPPGGILGEKNILDDEDVLKS